MARFIQQNRFLLTFALLVGLGSACSLVTPVSATHASKVDKEEFFRREVVSYAEKQLGAPYKYAGRNPKGFDCSGFTYYVMGNYKIPLSVSSRTQEKEGRGIPVKAAKTGDLIFFRRSKLGQVFHVAMVISNDRNGLRVIHSTSRGVVVDNVSHSSYWKPKISSARDVISGRY